MAEVINIVLPTTNFELPTWNPRPERERSEYRLTIAQTDGGNFFGAQIAPRNVTYSGHGLNWAEVSRDGRRPYLVAESQKIPTMSMHMVLAHADRPEWDATAALKVLRQIANTKVPLRISYGGYFESTWLWRCTEFEFESIQRHPFTDAITWAEVDMSFTIAEDVVLSVGPVSGGSGGTPAPEKPKGSTVGKRKYKVKKGDTWHSLSKKFYKSTKYWRYLADLNNSKYAYTGKTIKY